MWHKLTGSYPDKHVIFVYEEKFKDRVLTITFDDGPKFKLIAFRLHPKFLSASIAEPMTYEDMQIYGNPYHMSLKCVFEPSTGIIGSEKIL